MADILDKFNKSKAGWTFGGSAEDLTYRKKGDYIRGGEGGDTFFESSFDFLGDLSDKFGGTLSFRLRQDGSDPFFGGGGEVRITGANLQTLKLTFEQEPGTGWNTYKIRLDQFGGWRDNKNSIASEQIIRETLEEVTLFQIRGESRSGDTFTDLDTVKVTDSPLIAPDLGFVRSDLVRSDFNLSGEDWTFINDVRDFTVIPTGGVNNTGFLEAVDLATGLIFYYVAPSKFLGQKAGFMGGTLSFSLKVDGSGFAIQGDDVVIRGGNGVSLHWNSTVAVGDDWTQFELVLDETQSWLLNSASGARASNDDIKAVLSNLAALEIRGEFINGSETGGLDNVKLTAVKGNYDILAPGGDAQLLATTDTFEDAINMLAEGNILQMSGGGVERDIIFSEDDITLNTGGSYSGEIKLGQGVEKFTGNGLSNPSFRAETSVVGNGRNNEINVSVRFNEFAVEVEGRGGNDTINVRGEGGSILRGGKGEDTLNGGNGSDKLVGGRDNDTINGGRGNDRLLGQAGNDTFIYEVGNGHGNDTFVDFETGVDTIQLRSSGGLSFDTLQFGNRMDGTLVIDGLDGRIILTGYTDPSQLSASDFEFI